VWDYKFLKSDCDHKVSYFISNEESPVIARTSGVPLAGSGSKRMWRMVWCAVELGEIPLHSLWSRLRIVYTVALIGTCTLDYYCISSLQLIDVSVLPTNYTYP
jgi:hypothetical protein